MCPFRPHRVPTPSVRSRPDAQPTVPALPPSPVTHRTRFRLMRSRAGMLGFAYPALHDSYGWGLCVRPDLLRQTALPAPVPFPPRPSDLHPFPPWRLPDRSRLTTVSGYAFRMPVIGGCCGRRVRPFATTRPHPLNGRGLVVVKLGQSSLCLELK